MNTIVSSVQIPNLRFAFMQIKRNGNAEESVKKYFTDFGILIEKFDYVYAFLKFKSRAEINELSLEGKNTGLYGYRYSRPLKGSPDFVIEIDGKIEFIEVKNTDGLCHNQAIWALNHPKYIVTVLYVTFEDEVV